MKSRRIFFMFSAVIAASLMLSFCAPATTPDTTNPPATDFGPKFTIFVATNGSDANWGTNKNAPIRTMFAAFNMAYNFSFTNIYVGAGVYTIDNGIYPTNYSLSKMYGLDMNDDNIHIIGGWNASFTAVSGYSIFDGNNQNYSNFLYCRNVKNIELRNLVFQNATNDGFTDKIIVFKNMKDIMISNCTFSSLTTYWDSLISIGYITNLVFQNNIIINNTTGGQVVYIFGCSNLNVISCVITNNDSQLNTGLIWMGLSPYSRAVLISNNLLAGVYGSTSPIGIMAGVSNHTLINNIFVDNCLGYLYQYKTLKTNDINAVNDTAFTKATISSGNKITNF